MNRSMGDLCSCDGYAGSFAQNTRTDFATRGSESATTGVGIIFFSGMLGSVWSSSWRLQVPYVILRPGVHHHIHTFLRQDEFLMPQKVLDKLWLFWPTYIGIDLKVYPSWCPTLGKEFSLAILTLLVLVSALNTLLFIVYLYQKSLMSCSITQKYIVFHSNIVLLFVLSSHILSLINENTVLLWSTNRSMADLCSCCTYNSQAS